MRLNSPHRRLWMMLVVLVAGCTLNAAPNGNTAISGDPVVEIRAPQPNATYFEDVAVNIQATISNAGEAIDRVEIVIDGETVATLPDPNANDAAVFNVTHGWSATGIGAHTIGVTAFRPDGSSSAPTTVEINVVEQDGTSGLGANTPSGSSTTTSSTRQPTRAATQSQAQPTSAPATGAPTNAPAANTPDVPTASFQQGINVRRGPGLEFDPPIGAFAAGQTTQILAVNPAQTWYKVRYGGGEGWVFAQLTQTSGDLASLPRDPGPPVPTAPPATAVPPTTIPATAAPQSNANLVAGIVELSPGQPTCAQTFTIGLDVANLGSQPTNASSTVSVQDVRSADGSTQETTLGGFPVIQPQQTVRVNMPITVSTWYNEEHTIILIIDPNNEIPETEEGDNRREVKYTLQKGSCP